MRGTVALEGGPSIGAWLSVRVVLASFALTQLIAAGGVAGLAFIYWALRRLRFGARESLVRLLGLNTYVYLVFALIGFAAALAALVTGAARRVRGCAACGVAGGPGRCAPRRCHSPGRRARDRPRI